MRIRENVPLAQYTTLGVGGPARFFVSVTSFEEVQEALSFADERELPVCVLGGGSNVLVADDGFPGLMIHIALSSTETKEQQDGSVLVKVSAGVSWDEFVDEMVMCGYGGLEALSGIPGTVGGAVVANAGAYGAACSDSLESVRVLDLQDVKSAPKVFSNEQCKFAYHHSLFGEVASRYLILDAKFVLKQNAAPDFSYRDNRFNFTDIMRTESLPETIVGLRKAVLKIRDQKGQLEHCYKSAGSFFHMPYVSAGQYKKLTDKAQELDCALEERLRPWAWRQTDGSYKIAPGFLLEYTQFRKGYVRGNVGVSPKHTLSIINLGGATAQEIASLARDMHSDVQNKFSINLDREVRYVGNVRET